MPVAEKAGEVLGEHYDFTDYRSLADVGGASGGLAAGILKKYPGIQATVTDLPSVTPVARRLLDEAGNISIEVLDWDVLEGPCSQSFDTIVLRALIQVLSAEDARTALVNISGSLNPGGTVFVLGHIMDDSNELIQLITSPKRGLVIQTDMHRSVMYTPLFSAMDKTDLNIDILYSSFWGFFITTLFLLCEDIKEFETEQKMQDITI